MTKELDGLADGAEQQTADTVLSVGPHSVRSDRPFNLPFQRDIDINALLGMLAHVGDPGIGLSVEGEMTTPLA